MEQDLVEHSQQDGVARLVSYLPASTAFTFLANYFYIYRQTSDRALRLLSVQMHQTPACMWGLASITTCQLCVILFKNEPVLIFCLFSQCTETSEYTE